MPRRLVLAPLLALAAALPACGSGHSQASPAGRALFQEACGSCHTLTGHDDPRHQGGDLLGFHATREQMLQLAGEMPVRRPLSGPELEELVRFVMAMEAGHS